MISLYRLAALWIVFLNGPALVSGPAAIARSGIPGACVSYAAQSGKTSRQSKKKPEKPAPPAHQTLAQRRAAAAAALIREIAQGKVEPKLLTPSLRAKLTAAKLKSLRSSLTYFGPFKSVRLVKQEKSSSGATCTLRALFGDSAIIATAVVTNDAKVDSIRFIEE